MAGRIRTIKPEIIEDERSAGLSSDAWRLWVCMWLIADDHGNLRGDSRRLAADIFWAAPTPVSVPDLISELESADLIRRYQVRGQNYICIQNWAKHQRVDNAGKARVPGPEETDQNEDFAETRGEPPRLAAGPRPTTTTNDHDPTPVASAPGPALEPLKLEPPKQPSELPALLEVYCKSWVEAFQPSDGKPPKLQKADIKAASDLLKAHGLAEASSLIRRFLEDGDRFIAERGHVLRDIHQRVNGYRANKAPAKTASPGSRPRQPLASEVLAQKRKQWEGK